MANLHDKYIVLAENIILIKNIMQALKQALGLKKVVLLSYEKKQKITLKKKIKLMYNAIFGKAMDNVRKHRDIKVVTTEKRINYLVSEPNCHTTKFFIENLLAVEMRKTQILINQPVYLGLSILEISTKVMYVF